MQCRHRSCTCLVLEADPFCSDFCRRQPDDETLVVDDIPHSGAVKDCGCGHDACVADRPSLLD